MEVGGSKKGGDEPVELKLGPILWRCARRIYQWQRVESRHRVVLKGRKFKDGGDGRAVTWGELK